MIRIETMEGNRYDLRSIGIIPLNFYLGSLSPRHVTEESEGADGHIDMETTYEGRTMSARFLLRTQNYNEYAVKRNEVFRIFQGKKPFYLISEEELNKRWKVKAAAQFMPERLSRTDGVFEVEFISESPYAESLYSTLSIPPREILQTANGVWDGFEPEEMRYEFTESNFMVWNDGDVLLDPRLRFMEMLIRFKGQSNRLKIENKTTGDVFEYRGTTNGADTIELTGIRHLKNGRSIFKDTNHKLITLETGWNNFNISGTSGDFQIHFDCRFYYI